MRYFKNMDDLLFYKDPNSFNKYTNKDILKFAIGANMYMPGTKTDVFDKLIQNKFQEVGAITLCLEDAIAPEDVEVAEKNVLRILTNLAKRCQQDPTLIDELPLIFIRVRNPEEFEELAKRFTKEQLTMLCGFNFPKFNPDNGDWYFTTLERLSATHQEVLYGMPILEDDTIIYKETRFESLEKIQKILDKYHQYVLNIRVGGTDFSSLYGLRRNKYTTIYQVHVVQDCLMDILNFFLRSQKGYVVSGPVWEFFSWEKDSIENQNLKKELRLDIQNGFQGKTIIHPSQINIVNRAYAVDYYEYLDAISILSASGGVFKSSCGHRMNEVKPHTNWAKKVVAKAEIFGVLDKTASLEE